MLQVRRGADCQDRHRQGENSRIWMVIDYLRCVSGASLTADLYLYTTAPVWGAWDVTKMRSHWNVGTFGRHSGARQCCLRAAHSASQTNLSFCALTQLSVWFKIGVPTFLKVRKIRFCKRVCYSNFTQTGIRHITLQVYTQMALHFRQFQHNFYFYITWVWDVFRSQGPLSGLAIKII